MLCRLLAIPRPNAGQFRNHTKNSVQPRNVAFFAQSRRNNSQNSHPLISSNANSLLRRARNLEKSRNYIEAEAIYKEIVYKIDPTRKEAYDRLANLWGKKSVFGLTQNRLEDLFQQYEKHVKQVTPTSQVSEKPKPK